MIQFIRNLIARYTYSKEIVKHIQESPYKNNLYNASWLAQNHDDIMEVLPDSWTHEDNIDIDAFGFRMSCLGVVYDDINDLKSLLGYFETLGFLDRKDGYQLMRNPNTLFNRK